MTTNKEQRTNQSGTVVATAREIFEGVSGVEAVVRDGRNPQIKGVIHETMYKNAYNASPKRLVDGTQAVLSKSKTAIRDDVLIMKDGDIVKRLQLKDTSNSIGKTLDQVASGHYKGTNLMGTKETTVAYKNALSKSTKTITQQMKSSGISSNDTARVATKTIGTQAGNLTANSMKSLAKSSAKGGALISGAVETVVSGKKMLDGEIDGKEFVSNVAKETVSGGISSVAASTAGTLASTATATVLATLAPTAPLWIAPAIGISAAIAFGSGIKRFCDNLFY